MTLQQLKDFLAIVEFGGFRAAARTLKVSQGGLTKSIARLEDDYGVALLERSAKGILLTPEGEEFLLLARSAVQEANRVASWLKRAATRQQPTINIGVSIDPAIRLAPSVLNDFRNCNPDVALHITHSISSDLLVRLRDGRIELAVMRMERQQNTDDLEVVFLYRDKPAIMARAGHPLRYARRVSELTACDWIVVGGAPNQGVEDASLVELFDEAGLGRPRIAAYCSSLFDAISMLLDSDFLARLPGNVLHHPLVRDRIVAIEVEDPPRPYEIALVYRAARKLSREAQMLAAMIRSYVRVDQLRTRV